MADGHAYETIGDAIMPKQDWSGELGVLVVVVLDEGFIA